MPSLQTSTISPAADAHSSGQTSLAPILDVPPSVGQSACTASLGFYAFGFPSWQIVAKISSSAVAGVEIEKPQSKSLVVDIHKYMATVVYKCNNFFHIRGNYNINFCKKRLMDNQNLNPINRPLLQENSNPIIEEASNQQHFSQGNNKPTNN